MASFEDHISPILSFNGRDLIRIRRKVWIKGISDELQAASELGLFLPQTDRGLFLKPTELTRVADDIWQADVSYEERDFAEDDSIFNFQIGLGTAHITQAKEHIDSKTSLLFPQAVDHDGAINVTPDGVDGVDIAIPEFEWSWTVKHPRTLITRQYIDTLEELTGQWNSSTWKDYPEKEIQFLGCSGSTMAKEKFSELTYKFKRVRSVTNQSIGDINGVDKLGMDYLWVEYALTEDGAAQQLARIPKAVHVERVYDVGDFRKIRV